MKIDREGAKIGDGTGRGTFVPSVLDGKVEEGVRAERAQGVLIRTRSLVCCRKYFMVLRV